MRLVLELFEDDVKGDAQADEKHEGARDLEVKVLSAEWEVVLDGEEKVDEKH